MSNKKKIDQHQSDNTKTSKEKKVKDQLEQLYLSVKKHDISYYKDHNPSISDAEFSNPATFTIAPSGARLPFKPTTPPVVLKGLL